MRRKIMRLIVILGYWFGGVALFYFLNRKAKRILCFHNVMPDDLYRADIAPAGVMSLSSFEKMIDFCSKKFEFSTDFNDPSTLTLTFDDGYHNQYEYAYKFLRKRNISGCIFVSGDAYKTLIIDKIDHWNLLVPLEIVKNRKKFWNEEIWPRYLADSDNRGLAAEKYCDSLYPMYRIRSLMSEKYKSERFGGISKAEMDEMREAGWIIGWHTKSHYPLAYLSVDEVRRELTPVDKKMLDICFSYPYGVISLVGIDSVRVARELGYPFAVSNTMQEKENYSCWFMTRMQPPVDFYRLHYELSGFGHFLRTHKLLPIYGRNC